MMKACLNVKQYYSRLYFRQTMSLHPQIIPAIPQETIRVAYAAFPHGNIYLQLKDELGSVYEDESKWPHS